MRHIAAISIFTMLAGFACSQTAGSIQNSGDIYADSIRVSSPNNTDTISSPFNFGFLASATGVLRYVPPTEFIWSYQNVNQEENDVFIATGIQPSGESYNSQICWNFSTGQWGIGSSAGAAISPPGTVLFYAYDVIPAVEAKIPKGTYTFHATATPTAGASTPGTFEFETNTQGVWSTRFALSLTKAQGDTRTLTFAADTRVRWLLIPQGGGQLAQAAIVAQFYNSGS